VSEDETGPLRLADVVVALGSLGRDAILREPCVKVEEETRKPERINALYSSGVKTLWEMAEWVPMRLRMSRNFSAPYQFSVLSLIKLDKTYP
jgi:hypothetical protein